MTNVHSDMIVKAKPPEPIKPKPVCGQTGNKVVQPIRCTASGEVMVYQAPGTVGDGVNRKNKDGVLALGDDGNHLRNIKVRSDGAVVTCLDESVEVVVTQAPLEVLNMPSTIGVDGVVTTTPLPEEVRMIPFSFDGHGIVIEGPLMIYSVQLIVNESSTVEVVGMMGAVYTNRISIDLSPHFIRLDKLEIKTREHVCVGGYIQCIG